MGWGKGADASAKTGLVLMCALTGALLLAIVGGWFDAANARARDATSRCERIGRRYNVHGQAVCVGQVSDDGMQTWEDVR